MKKQFSIKKSKEIEQIIKNKESYGNKYFVIYKMKNETNSFRFALSIGRKFGIAVKRNKIKSQIRNIIRNNINMFENYNYIIVINPTSSNLNFLEIKENILDLTIKVNKRRK